MLPGLQVNKFAMDELTIGSVLNCPYKAASVAPKSFITSIPIYSLTYLPRGR